MYFVDIAPFPSTLRPRSIPDLHAPICCSAPIAVLTCLSFLQNVSQHEMNCPSKQVLATGPLAVGAAFMSK